ncbi:MerR family transcriptional regulator [Collinsella sp. zg1085]|uniref:transcriptional regulator FtsR n=1 Tax=Collinsella sp. zg1085 TaxID=2844380 RepID=UPI001C0AA219|nr:MerR family transcriptional regulator [Collinsella sp. zg1085]QWT17011.1 MerR family transcriptional regulator [Collinsella sp. zg1085]
MAERSYLSIGQVVNLLRGAYPDLSNSKIRFLEDEGLITPHRTPKGYRQYSKDDVDRLEVILHLQKTRYMPLNVIKDRLERAQDLSMLAFEVGLLSDAPLKTAPRESKQKLHPIEDLPNMLGVDISFLRSLADNDLIRIIRSPQNRELIDGREFEIIRFASELSRFHIEPRNLRQYVSAANRESTMFEQVLIGMLGMDTSDEDRASKLERAFTKLHDLTDGVRTALIRNRVFESLNAEINDEELEINLKRSAPAKSVAAASASKPEVIRKSTSSTLKRSHT